MKHHRSLFRALSALLCLVLCTQLTACGQKDTFSPASGKRYDDSLITEAISKEGSFTDEHGQEWDYSYHIPQLADDTTDAESINKAIMNILSSDVQTMLSSASVTKMPETHYADISWQSHWNGSLLSLSLHLTGWASDIVSYEVYHYDFASGRRLTNAQVLDRFDVSREDFIAALRCAAAQTYDTVYAPWGVPELSPDDENFGPMCIDLASVRAWTIAEENYELDNLRFYPEQGGSFTSLQDFCDRMYDCGDMNKRAVENLIRSGAFDSMGARRSQLLAVYEKVLDGIGNVRRRNVEGQIDFFGMSAANSTVETVVMPDIPEFTATERMHMEKETTGLYLSGHPMVGYRAAARSSGAVTLNEILEDVSSEEGPTRFADGMPVTVAGIVASSKTRPTKNGTLMAYVVLEDETASMELLCFSRVLERCGSYLAVNSPVLIKGRLSLRDEKPPQIVPDVVFPLESCGVGALQDGKAAESDTAAVYLRVKSIDDPAFSHLLLVATMFEGKVPLKIRIADTGKLWGGFCLDHPAFLKECREWLGPENVVVRRKEKSE